MIPSRGLVGGAMAPTVYMVLTVAEREQLAAIVADRNRSRRHLDLAHMVLASRIESRGNRWRKASASAGRQCGA